MRFIHVGERSSPTSSPTIGAIQESNSTPDTAHPGGEQEPAAVLVPNETHIANEDHLGITTPPEHGTNSDKGFLVTESVATWITGGGLVLLALSPFFKWINFGAGGATGLVGDGRFVIAISALAVGAFIFAATTRTLTGPVLLSVQAWGTVAAFWMGGLIWSVATMLDSRDVQGNPFGALFAIQISPGVGLYLGLVGGLTVAAAGAYLAVNFYSHRRTPYWLTQSLSLLLGVILALASGLDVAPRAGERPDVFAASDDTSTEAGGGGGGDDGAAKAAYIAEHLELYDVSAAYEDTFLKKNVPGVRFKIRNRGERTLERVEVTVYFKDGRGDVIAEEDFLPVLVSDYSFSENRNKPLKPRYIWQMEEGKFFAAESVPSEWQEGSIDAAITEIEFSE